MFTFAFGSQSMNTMLMTSAGMNTDATAFQHTGTLYILWLSMKMDVSTALQLILSKMVNACITTHHGFREPICSSFKWLKKWKNTTKQNFWTSIMYLRTHHAHTLLYPSCTWTMLGTVSHITPMQWINLKWCLVGFPKPVPSLALRSWSARLKGGNLHDGCQPSL